MNIYIGADHRGFNLKERIKAMLAEELRAVTDVGAHELYPTDDYPDFAIEVARKVANDPLESRGIVICGSGFGVDIVANRVSNVRSALAMSPDHIYQGRHDDDANVLAIGADFVSEEDAFKMVKVFLTTPFSGEERHVRRLRKIEALPRE